MNDEIKTLTQRFKELGMSKKLAHKAVQEVINSDSSIAGENPKTTEELINLMKRRY